MIKVFSRLAWRKEGGEYVPYGAARKTHICTVETVKEAREMCADGPANKALAAGKEYRHLPFHEFEGVA